MVKWQDIAKYAGSGTLGLFIILAGILNMSGMTYTIPEDQICTDCYDAIYVNSTIWEIKVEHAGDKGIVFAKRMRSRTRWVNLDKISNFVDTSPEVPVEILVPTIKRYSTIKHDKYGYLRPIKDGDTLIARKNKNNPNGDWFVIHGNTGKQNIKWGMSLNSWTMKDLKFDPIWEYKNPSNLTVLWHFDGNAIDSSNSNDGTISNAVPTNKGRFEGAYEFDGSAVIYATNINLDSTSSKTISAWINTASFHATPQIAVLWGLGTHPKSLSMNLDTVDSIGCSAWDGIAALKSVIPTDTWFHLACVYNGSHIIQYLNGSLVGSRAKVIDASGNNYFSVGARKDTIGETNYFNGTIDEVRVYNLTLTPSEIRELYNETKVSSSVQLYGNATELKLYGSADEAVINKSELVALLHLNGNALDFSDVGNDGTVTNALPTNKGKFEGAYDFDGDGDYISITADTSLNFTNTTPFAVTLWFNRPEGVAASDSFIGYYDAPKYWHAGFGADGKVIARIGQGAGGSYQYIISSSTYNDSQWHHFGWTYDGVDTQILYIDGINIGQTTTTPSEFDSILDRTIGAIYNSGSGIISFFNGTIDEVRIYNQTLSNAQVLKLYNETLYSHSKQIYGSAAQT